MSKDEKLRALMAAIPPRSQRRQRREHLAEIERVATTPEDAPMLPTYYVRHPDGSYSIAEPQPTPEQIASQRDFVYAQCDQKHGGSCCEDPNCWRVGHPERDVGPSPTGVIASDGSQR